MGTPVTEGELARRQKMTDDRWQIAVDLYKKNYPDSERECQRMCEYMRRTGLKIARRLFATTMMRMHMEIATETGEFLGPFEEDEKVDPKLN